MTCSRNAGSSGSAFRFLRRVVRSKRQNPVQSNVPPPESNMSLPLADVAAESTGRCGPASLPPHVVEGVLASFLSTKRLGRKVQQLRVDAALGAESLENLGGLMVTLGKSDEEAVEALRSGQPKPPGWESAFESDLPLDQLEARNREFEQRAALDRRLGIEKLETQVGVDRKHAQRPARHSRQRRPACGRQRGSRRVTRGSPCDDSDPGGDSDPPAIGPTQSRRKSAP